MEATAESMDSATQIPSYGLVSIAVVHFSSPLLTEPSGRFVMSWFRQYVAPLLIVLIFAIALVAVMARAFLPGDMAAPAPILELLPLLPE